MTADASVSVIIPCRNAANTLGRTLSALSRQVPTPPDEVIVVDDGSSDGSAELAEMTNVVTRVLRQRSEGPAAARNRGAAEATGELLVFLDADCEPTPRWLAIGRSCARHADFVQGAVLPSPEEELGPFDRSLWVTRSWGLYESANLFVRRALFEAVGGFESWLVPADGKELGEDALFGWRVRRSGAPMRFCDEALVHHAVFRRGVRGFVAERARLRYFPALADRIPELRDTFFYRRWFLSRRSAAFDAALVGTVLLASGRGSGPVVTLPYAALLCRDVRGQPLPFAVKVMVAQLAADALGFAAMIWGSIEHRTVVL